MKKKLAEIRPTAGERAEIITFEPQREPAMPRTLITAIFAVLAAALLFVPPACSGAPSQKDSESSVAQHSAPPLEENLAIGKETFGGLRITSYPPEIEADLHQKLRRAEAGWMLNPGLCAIGSYDRTRMPPLPNLFLQAVRGGIAPGSSELIGRLPPEYTPLKIMRFTRRGNEINIEAALSPERSKDSNYIWGELPQNLPAGRYRVELMGYECEEKDGVLAPAPKTDIRAFYEFECYFAVNETPAQAVNWNSQNKTVGAIMQRIADRLKFVQADFPKAKPGDRLEFFQNKQESPTGGLTSASLQLQYDWDMGMPRQPPAAGTSGIAIFVNAFRHDANYRPQNYTLINSATAWDGKSETRRYAFTNDPFGWKFSVTVESNQPEIAARINHIIDEELSGPKAAGTIDAKQTDFLPEPDAFYALAPGTTYIPRAMDDFGPAGAQMSIAWNAAVEFVNRTALRKEYQLPAASQWEQDDGFICQFSAIAGGDKLKVFVTPDFKLVKRITRDAEVREIRKQDKPGDVPPTGATLEKWLEGKEIVEVGFVGPPVDGNTLDGWLKEKRAGEYQVDGSAQAQKNSSVIVEMNATPENVRRILALQKDVAGHGYTIDAARTKAWSYFGDARVRAKARALLPEILAAAGKGAEGSVPGVRWSTDLRWDTGRAGEGGLVYGAELQIVEIKSDGHWKYRNVLASVSDDGIRLPHLGLMIHISYGNGPEYNKDGPMISPRNEAVRQALHKAVEPLVKMERELSGSLFAIAPAATTQAADEK